MSEPLFHAPVEGDDNDNYPSSDMTPRKLRRSIAKEELVALCDDFIDAVLLNQMITYQASCRDKDAYIEEERQRMAARGQILNLPHSRGFFYKKAEELSEESMVGLHKSNIGKRLRRFEERGWIEHRNNPNDKFDYVYQYRVDVVEIDRRIKEIGFPGLDGWLMTKINPGSLPPENEAQRRSSESQLRGSDTQPRSSTGLPRSSRNDTPSKDSKKQQQVATKQAPTNKHPAAPVVPSATVPPAPASAAVEDAVLKFKNVAVVEEVGPESSSAQAEADDRNTPDSSLVKDLICEGISRANARAMEKRFGEAECNKALDDPSLRQRLLSEIEAQAEQKEKEAAEPLFPTSAKSSSPLPAGAVRSMPSVELPPSDVEDRMQVLEEMYEAAPKIETRVAQKLVADYGPMLCRAALAELPGFKADKPEAMLVWAIKTHMQRKNARAASAPVEETRDQAIARAEGNRAAELTADQKQAAAEAENAKLDTMWKYLPEYQRTRVEAVIVKRIGTMFGEETVAWKAQRRELQREINAGRFGEIWDAECLGAASQEPPAQEEVA